MSIFHYFSKDPNKRAKFIFNFIAPIYNILVNDYTKAIEVLDDEIGVNGKTVLDIGTGTGAWAKMFEEKGAKQVTGLDFSNKMLKQSKNNHHNINFIEADAEDMSMIADNSFDIVTASFVIHGVKIERREKILLEMKRISKQYVVLNDFVGKTPIFVRFLEFMEKSDYKFFKKNICNELKQLFSTAKKIDIKEIAGLYIAEI